MGEPCCEICHRSDEQLHLHHKTYTRLGNERLHDFMLICSTHHTEIHLLEKTSDFKLWNASSKIKRDHKKKLRKEKERKFQNELKKENKLIEKFEGLTPKQIKGKLKKERRKLERKLKHQSMNSK